MFNKPIILTCAALAVVAIPGMAQAHSGFQMVAYQSGKVEFKAFDTNSDGRISQGEFMSQSGASLKEFSMIDTNRDNALSQSEVTAYNDIGDGPDIDNNTGINNDPGMANDPVTQ